jgi:tetratricopeptide (TPR) repeat protein
MTCSIAGFAEEKNATPSAAPGQTGVTEFVLAQGKPAPAIHATDLKGNTVDLDAIIQQKPYLVILYFFTVDTGADIAMKLGYLDMHYGRDKLKIIALGMKNDEAALKSFADRLGIEYAIIDTNALKDAGWLKNIHTPPVTLFVQADPSRTIERVLVGGGAGQAQILKEVAENLFQQRKSEAAEIADQAAAQGEDKKAAGELKGYILASQGKLDEAEKEFGQIDSKTGLASVALTRGKLDDAVKLADQAGNGYAQTIKGEALIKQGKLDEAAKTLQGAADQPAANWQKSEGITAQGRVTQQQGNADAAIGSYKNAVALDPYNVVALSNEGAAHREKGDLKEAETVLAKAAQVRPDDNLSALMLQQVQRELKDANDIKRGELIRQQIADLGKRYKEIKDSGAKPADDWSTRPLIVAFLPNPKQSPMVFTRAGTDVVLQREIESRLQSDGRVGVVERQMLDQLLQELNLGSSEVAAAETQRRLGKMLSAGMLGFFDFAQLGPDAMLYLRMVDTETTGIAFQISQPVDENNPAKTVSEVMDKLTAQLANGHELKGLIADAADENAVIINLGKKHGVKEGQEFTVYAEGDPIEVGGKVIAHRQKPVAKLTVTSVEAEYAVGKIGNKRDGATIAKEMKIKGQ